MSFTIDYCNLNQTTMRVAARSFAKEYDRAFLQTLLEQFGISLSPAVLACEDYVHTSLISFYLRSLHINTLCVVASPPTDA